MSTKDLWISANDRFKERASDWMASGIIAAVLMHVGLFAFFPDLNAANLDVAADASEVVDLPPEVRIPPPPDEIPRPATPRISETATDDIILPPSDFESNPPENLKPPPAGRRPSDVPVWIDRDVEPHLTNSAEMERLLEQRYPSALREAGIGGTVTLHVFVTEHGVPETARIHRSSGYPQLDAAAAVLVERMRFTPAMNRDRPVGVWVLQEVRFSSR